MSDGIGTFASFNQPKGITIDSMGFVFVVDAYYNQIRKISTTG